MRIFPQNTRIWSEYDLSSSTIQLNLYINLSNYGYLSRPIKASLIVFFFFLIRNEEEYINRKKEKIQEKEKLQKKEKKPREGWEVLPTQTEQRRKLPTIEL